MTKASVESAKVHGTANEHAERIITICRREQLTIPQTAYVLATVRHESKMGLWMLDQASGWAFEGRHHLGNVRRGDGPRYRGRGYIRIVGRRAYAAWEQELGLPLVAEPDRVTEPDVAAEIAVLGMKWGRFSGVPLSEHVNEGSIDYVGARRVVNGQDRAILVSRYAREYEAQLRAMSPTAAAVTNVKLIQRQLRAIGWPLVVDGFLGTFTRRALADFQRGYTFEQLAVTGQPNGATTRALSQCATQGGLASPHFRFTEFRTAGPTKLTMNNRAISVNRDLVEGLERYRELAGEPVRIASGYRSVRHNQKVGGAPDSPHLRGTAVDLWFPRLPVALVLELGTFTTIGTRRGVVVHLEVDPEGSTASPVQWTRDP